MHEWMDAWQIQCRDGGFETRVSSRALLRNHELMRHEHHRSNELHDSPDLWSIAGMFPGCALPPRSNSGLSL